MAPVDEDSKAFQLAPLRRAGVAEGITALDLSFNDEARELDEALADRLARLKRLDLTGVDLAALPPGLARLESLEELRLGLTTLDGAQLEAITHLPHLKILDLQSARIGALPEGLERLAPSLEELDLSGTELENAPGLTALRRLRRLDLFGLAPEGIPDELWRLEALEDLSLGDREGGLRELPEAVSRLPALRRLSVRGALDRLPPGLAAGPRLVELELADNRLDDRVWLCLAELTALRQLTLSGNLIRGIPDAVGRLVALRVLRLRGCPLESIDPAIGALSRLELLDLAGGALRELPESLAALPELRELDLGGNALESLPESWSRCRQLRRLDLSENRLRRCPPELLRLPRLHSLALTANPFDEQGAAQLEDFTRGLYARDAFAEVAPPRRAAVEPREPKAAAGGLLPEITAELRRLGARSTSAGPSTIATAAGRVAIPEPAREWLGYTWPAATYAASLPDGRQLWSVDFRACGALADFECSFQQPLIAIADFHGGNSLLLINLADPALEDPRLYHIDHEDAAAPSALDLGLRLSELAKILEREA